jgi:4-diphosphocytidyl-2-C-methyl-D-erythritol kinase
MVYFPNAKINLGLRITNKREDGYHDLETVFYPISIKDGLEIIEAEALRFTQSGNTVAGDPENNLCLKAYRLLKKDFPSLPACHIHLHKIIPERGGLAGGSADGSYTLLLLNKKFGLGISEERLKQYALSLGSDCPFFIVNRPCLGTGRGEVLTPVSVDLSGYALCIVNPGIAIETKKAFSQIRPSGHTEPILENALNRPIETWKDHVFNDFESYVFQAHPEIGAIKQTLYESGALYASLSGSGSSVFGIFRERTAVSFSARYFQLSLSYQTSY